MSHTPNKAINNRAPQMIKVFISCVVIITFLSSLYFYQLYFS